MLKVKFVVSTIGKDDMHDLAFETDTVISDATMETFDDIDLHHDKEKHANNSSFGSSSNSIMEKYNEELSQVCE